MESRKDTASLKNPVHRDGDSDKNTNCKDISRQRGANDNDAENVFTSVSNLSDSNPAPLNGPLTRFFSSSNNESIPQSSRSCENNVELNKNSGGILQSNNRNNYSDLMEATCSSRMDSKTYDVSAQSCQKHKVCLDKAGNSYTSPSTSDINRDTENVGFRESRKRPSTLKLNRPILDADESSSDTGNDDYSLGSEDGCIYTYRGGQHLADLPSSFFSLDMGLPLDRHLPAPNYQVGQQVAPARDPASRASSPDMDFLEMDFDPGPSCEVDSGDESTPDVELEEVNNMPEENEPVVRGTSPEYLPGTNYSPPIQIPVPSVSRSENAYCYNVPSTSQNLASGQGDIANDSGTLTIYGPFITHINVKGEQLLVRRTMSHFPTTTLVAQHVSSGDLVSPREILNYDEEHAEGPLTFQINQGEMPVFDSANISSAMYHLNMAKRMIGENPEPDLLDHDVTGNESVIDTAGCSTTDVRCVEPPRCMIWSEREACERQVTQIATSACGATAVVNVFIALGVPVNLEKINSAVGTRQRANNAPLPRYILSRAVAGCTAADLVTGIQRASDGLVTARFFPTHPERAVSLSHWLADWISLAYSACAQELEKFWESVRDVLDLAEGNERVIVCEDSNGWVGTKRDDYEAALGPFGDKRVNEAGAVPIVTLNLQVGCEGEIPDAWHHQMVFGVSPRGVFLCNPVECVRESVLWPRLTSPSVLLVRTRDVLARFTANTDLSPLMFVPDRRFHTFNVLGQVVNVIREWRSTGWSEQGTRTHHVRIPAAYQAGVTVAALTGSEAHRRLMHVSQLPIINPQAEPA